MSYIYCTTKNYGGSFITRDEDVSPNPLGAKEYPGNVWVCNNNITGQKWVEKVHGVQKSKSEAQALVDAAISAAQTAYDAKADDSTEKLKPMPRPESITLP